MKISKNKRSGRGRTMLGTAAILAAALGAGCADAPEKKADEKPVQGGRAPEKQAPARGASADATGSPEKAPGHPPDDNAGGNKNSNPQLDEIHKNLTLHDQERAALAQHYFKVGKQFYDQFDYAEAAKNFQLAKETDPNDKTIQQYYIMSAMLAGDRQPEFQAVTERLREERGVAIDQQVLELKRLHDEGVKLLQAHEFDKAIVRFEQVLEKIRWFPYPVSDAGIEKSARENIIIARKQKRDQDNAIRIVREKQALDSARNEEDAAKGREAALTAKLIRDGVELLDLDKYEKAEATFRGVLEREPNNEQAQKFLEIAIEGRHVNRNIRTHDSRVKEEERDRDLTNEITNTYVPDNKVAQFPDKEYWRTVSARRSGIQTQASEEPAWITEYKKKLANQKVTFNFAATPFTEVVNFLQDITGLNITVAKDIDSDQLKVTLHLKEVLLENALKIILEQTNLARTFQNETLLITQKDKIKGEYYLDIYDVQDILAAIPDFPGPRIKIASKAGGGGGGGARGGGSGAIQFDDDTQEETGSVIEPEKLEALVKNSTGADEAWTETSSYELHRNQIIVNQTKEVHENIRKVLQNLRRNVGLFVQVEARFILIHNDFLQDIGVDYRGLGLSDRNSTSPLPIWGTAANLDPNIPGNDAARRGGDDMGFGQRINARNAGKRLGPSIGGIPFFGSSMLGGRVQNILDAGDAYFGPGERLNNTTVAGGQPSKGLAFQASILDPIQISAIVRAEQERLKEKIVTAPVVVAANRQRVHLSVVTQRAYISDYSLSSGGTGLVVAEVAEPIIQTLQEGIVLDVRPTISADRKYVTLDVRPTLASLQSLKQIPVNLGTLGPAAINVNIEVPEIKLQEAFTSVTVPDGGTALVGGFRHFNEKQQRSGVPFVDNVPLLNVLFKREAELRETESLVILMTARIIVLRDEEKKRYNSPAK